MTMTTALFNDNVLFPCLIKGSLGDVFCGAK